ncbi:MAG: response regulator transcription factor [Myxococcota bacterium]|jgi:two-component system alkaline phosphatase synthesis response regulator PhoP|nr:response regulator transcription factor [Myxococcota bacterium]
MSKRILIVEDEERLRRSLTDFFTLEGYRVTGAADGEAGLAAGLDKRPDLVLLDIMLPGMHGFDVCEGLREGGFRGPILFLTAKGEEIDKLTGFDIGGDDYVTKPFSLLELHARVKALLRRSDGVADEDEVHEFDGIVVNFTTYEVDVRGNPVRLSAKEMELLRFLIRNRGKVLSRDLLLEEVWHYDSDLSTRTVDTHILNLRRKLGDPTDRTRYIETIHGVGYKFVG